MLVRGSSFWPMKIIRTYKPLRTLLFMIFTGIIVDSMYLDSESVFWLFKPLKKYIKRTHSHVNGNGYGNGTSKSAAIHHFCHHTQIHMHFFKLFSSFFFHNFKEIIFYI